jgi:hypothetical protein
MDNPDFNPLSQTAFAQAAKITEEGLRALSKSPSFKPGFVPKLESFMKKAISQVQEFCSSAKSKELTH